MTPIQNGGWNRSNKRRMEDPGAVSVTPSISPSRERLLRMGDDPPFWRHRRDLTDTDREAMRLLNSPLRVEESS